MNVARGRQGVVVLGSTGSIGRSTLDVLASLPQRFRVVGLSASRNARLLQAQIDAFRPAYASLTAKSADLHGATIIDTPDALSVLATLDEADIVVVATSGHVAIQPTIDALKAGKVVALANKETIVAAGEIVMPIARATPGRLRPVDSEHSALWQCLHQDRADTSQVRRLILTASGGPFRGWTREQLRDATPADALKHPTWSMGDKITIDSATLMNKGLELIEAHWLFDFPLAAIDIVVHPQSVVHSLVEFHDGSLLAQLGPHDMRLPIQYALTYPDRVAGVARPVDLLKIGRLDFEPPDLESFPLVSLARDAGARGSTFPTVLSTADEVAVDAFLNHRIPLMEIATLVEQALASHLPDRSPVTIEAIIEADRWARRFVADAVAERARGR